MAEPLSVRRTSRRPEPTRVVEARLEMTEAGCERLESAMRLGIEDFVISSRDGRVSARVRMRVGDVSPTLHRVNRSSLLVDWSRAVVVREKNQVSLSRTELRLLAALLEGNGRAVSRSQLISRVWADDHMESAERVNALAVYICSLRKRLSSIGAGSALKTVRGIGYRLQLDGAARGAG